MLVVNRLTEDFDMAFKAVVGRVGGLYANNFGAWIQIVGHPWFQVQATSSSWFLTVASDARRADIPVYLSYEDTNLTAYEIQSL